MVPSYEASSTYLKEIVTLLPVGNKVREFIDSEIEFSENQAKNATTNLVMVCSFIGRR